MVVCYNILWKLLIDRGLNKTKLAKLAGISSSTLAYLSKNKHVSMGVTIKKHVIHLIAQLMMFIDCSKQLVTLGNSYGKNDRY